MTSVVAPAKGAILMCLGMLPKNVLVYAYAITLSLDISGWVELSNPSQNKCTSLEHNKRLLKDYLQIAHFCVLRNSHKSTKAAI